MPRGGVIAATLAAIWGGSSAAADETSATAALSAPVNASFVGVSSYYGAYFDGRPTANGETFDMNALTAASKTLPLPCYARVTNLRNRRSLVVRVNDRGPYISGRMLDVSERVAKLLRYNGGLERVRLDYLGPAGPAGAGDQRALMASLRTGSRTVDTAVAARAKPSDEGVSVAQRIAPALAFAEASARPQAPAAAALNAAVRSAPAPEPLGVAAQLTASARQLEAALQDAHQAAKAAAGSVATALSPYGDLVIIPFKPLVEASR